MPDSIVIDQTRAKISALDLRGVHNDLMKNEGFTEERADRAITWYRMFLEFVAEHPGKHLAPPGAADLAWHNHILDTRRYFDDCLDLFGGYLHHDPEAFGTVEFDRGWGFTRDLYADRYGVDLPEEITSEEDSDAVPTTCFVANVEKVERGASVAEADASPTTCFVAGVEKVERGATVAEADAAPTTCFVAGVEKVERGATVADADAAPTTCFVAGVEKVERGATVADADASPTTCFVAGVEKIERGA